METKHLYVSSTYVSFQFQTSIVTITQTSCSILKDLKEILGTRSS